MHLSHLDHPLNHLLPPNLLTISKGVKCTMPDGTNWRIYCANVGCMQIQSFEEQISRTPTCDLTDFCLSTTNYDNGSRTATDCGTQGSTWKLFMHLYWSGKQYLLCSNVFAQGLHLIDQPCIQSFYWIIAAQWRNLPWLLQSLDHYWLYSVTDTRPDHNRYIHSLIQPHTTPCTHEYKYGQGDLS